MAGRGGMRSSKPFVVQWGGAMCVLCEASSVVSDDIGVSKPGTIDGHQVESATDASLDDCAQDITTANIVSVGQVFYGSLEVKGDRDWVALSLSAGQAVEIQLNGTTLVDPYLRIYDASGTLLAQNDDANVYDSEVIYTSPIDQVIYIEAAAWGDRFSGDYQISVTEVVPPGPVDAISWSGQLSDTSIDVWFSSEGYVGGTGVTSEEWTAYEIEQFRVAFSNIEAVSNVRFNIVDSAADADFILQVDTDGEMSGNTLGYFYPPGTVYAGLGVFNGAAWDRTGAQGSLEEGGRDFVTIVHELLHGMGLAHPHDTGGGSAIMLGVSGPFNSFGDELLNQGVYTAMSYNSGFYSGDVGARSFNSIYGFQSGPMALDIAVLQGAYGANTATATGDDTYILPGSNYFGTSYTSIWDAGGVDELVYEGNRNATIDLRPATLAYEQGGGGYISAASGVAGGYTIANGVVIENATTGRGHDILTGNDADNRLRSGAGNDLIFAGAGNDTVNGGWGADTLQGGAGQDVLDYSSSLNAVNIDLSVNSARGGDAWGDVIEGFEHIIGTDYGDTLSGNAFDNLLSGSAGADLLNGMDGSDELSGGLAGDTLLGGAGDDRLDGGYGDDHLEGGTGHDTAIYSGFGGGIRINLNLGGPQNTGAAGMDTLIEIESLIGGDFNDVFVGLSVDNTLFGYGGSDRLFGLGGNDTLDGGAGNDVIVGGNGDDILSGGFSGRDVLLGGGGNDSMSGGEELDQLRGGTGSDTLFGGQGRDVLVGGDFNAGAFLGDGAVDVFLFLSVDESRPGGRSRDVIRDFEQGIDIIDLSGIDAIAHTLGEDDAFSFVGASSFSGVPGELRALEVNGNTVIRADVDGDARADFELLLNGSFILTASDFHL